MKDKRPPCEQYAEILQQRREDKLESLIESIMMYGKKQAPITFDYKQTKPAIEKYKRKLKNLLQ